MKILKRILIILALLVGALVIIGLLMPRERHVERSLTMKANPEVIFDQVNNLKNWENWSPWIKLDPASVRTYSDQTIGKGASYSWTSKSDQVGNGTLTIIPHFSARK